VPLCRRCVVAENDTAHKLDQTLVDIRFALESAVQTVDAVVPLDTAECGGCSVSEECYPYQAKPVVEPSLCADPCPANEACVQVKKSGADQHQCVPKNTCSPTKSGTTVFPIAPLVTCVE